MNKSQVNATVRLIKALENTYEGINDDFDDPVLNATDIERQLQQRHNSDKLERQFRRPILDAMFPNRTSGKLYACTEDGDDTENFIDY